MSNKFIMKGQGGSRGATRDLTADPNFIMRQTDSPPQGVKRSGGNKTTSAEKKNKSASKEGPTSKQLWLGFEMMEKLAIEEGTPIHTTPTTLHTLIRNGFSDKEAKEFLKATPAYPHVGQSCYPFSRLDSIT